MNPDTDWAKPLNVHAAYIVASEGPVSKDGPQKAVTDTKMQAWRWVVCHSKLNLKTGCIRAISIEEPLTIGIHADAAYTMYDGPRDMDGCGGRHAGCLLS
jgi:hypothetical protein